MDNFLDIDIEKVSIPTIFSCFYSTKNYYEIDRIYKIFLFYRYLCRHKKFSKITRKEQHEIIKNLEKACYDNAKHMENIVCGWSEEFAYTYHIICGKVLSYFDINYPKKANIIIENLISDIPVQIFSKTLPYKSIRDLFPEEYDKVEKTQCIEEQITVKASKLRTCPKCKRRLSTTKNRYARSLDEGVDLTATCVFCGFSWAC